MLKCDFEIFERDKKRCIKKFCELMADYGERWIFHLDELGESADVENWVRDHYGLWNTGADIEKFMREHGND